MSHREQDFDLNSYYTRTTDDDALKPREGLLLKCLVGQLANEATNLPPIFTLQTVSGGHLGSECGDHSSQTKGIATFFKKRRLIGAHIFNGSN